jgi:hypothetical protein
VPSNLVGGNCKLISLPRLGNRCNTGVGTRRSEIAPGPALHAGTNSGRCWKRLNAIRIAEQKRTWPNLDKTLPINGKITGPIGAAVGYPTSKRPLWSINDFSRVRF